MEPVSLGLIPAHHLKYVMKTMINVLMSVMETLTVTAMWMGPMHSHSSRILGEMTAKIVLEEVIIIARTKPDKVRTVE